MDNREEEEASYPPRILLLRNLISSVHASRAFLLQTHSKLLSDFLATYAIHANPQTVMFA